MTDIALALGGMLVLSVILAAGLPRGLGRAGLFRWARSQLPLLSAGAAVTVAVAAVLAFRPPAGAWATLVGLAAAAVAYFAVVPRGPRRGAGRS